MHKVYSKLTRKTADVLDVALMVVISNYEHFNAYLGSCPTTKQKQVSCGPHNRGKSA